MRAGMGRVALLTLAVLALAPPASAGELFDPTQVAEIDLTIPQASRDALA